jgi:uncharacterized protein
MSRDSSSAAMMAGRIVTRENSNSLISGDQAMTRNTLRALIACAFVFAYTSFVAAQGTADPRLITVTGEAEIRVQPDEIVFKIEIENVDKDLVAAKRANDEGVKKVLALVRRYRIEPQDVKTDYISVEPKYSDRTDEKPHEFIGYEVSKTAFIRLRDLSSFEGLLSDALQAGVHRVYDVQFLTTQLRKYKDQARALAIKAAQEKAIALTREIGQKIGKAYTINEGISDRGGPLANLTISTGGDYSTSDSGSAFAVGQISVSAGVTVSFELE